VTVFLTGGTGFVGRHILPRLLRDGHHVRALVRQRGGCSGIAAAPGTLEEVAGDILRPSSLTGSMAGCSAVIHLVGIIYERGSATFESVHHQGTKNVLDEAAASGVHRFVHMSALGARSGDASAYHTTKFAAEEEMRESGMAYVILRPSLIFGQGSAFVQQMVDVMRAAPFVRPVPGTGEYRFRPVYIDDVVECFVQSLDNPAALDRTIELVGSEELSLNEIAAEIAACIGVRKKAVHVPLSLMKIAAAAFAVLPIKPPVTSVQIRMLQEGSIADHPGPMMSIFGIQPVGFREGLRRYLCPKPA
jgi:uncharacterized protein YbjT (DUF2867 family)